ncbi:MAG: lipase [Clostridia bacterium]|nr:lipase [Clostridia bacterium]
MSKWVTFWGNATSVADRRPETYAKNLTLRYPISCPFGGNSIRLHFSNFCGTEPVTLSQVTVAPAISRREINLKDAALVTFSGKESVTIPAGEEIFSDEISFRVKPLGTISVSFYLKDFTQMRSAVVITGPLSGGFYSVGNQTLASVLPLNQTRTTQTYYFFTGADVLTEDKNRAVICYGDSITSQSWPDELQLLCNADPYNQTAVIRRAASGTRVLREYSCITYESYGLCGKRRFKREISTVSGADTVIIQQGINDIIHPVGTEVNPFRPMSDLPTAKELEEGLAYYIRTAKSRGLKTLVGTLLPIFGWRTYAPFREDLKEEINAWLRGNCGADGLIDFDKALRSEKDARAFKQGFDSGDHLHPSEDAYKQMAVAAFDKIKLI